MTKLLPVETNSNKAPNAVEYDATIWDRLSPASRRNINRLSDLIGKEKKK